MTLWLPNLARFCKQSQRQTDNDETKRQKVAHILDKLISLTIEEVEMYPSIQVWSLSHLYIIWISVDK